MITNETEMVTCNGCGTVFPADELIMGKVNDNHTIDDWHCPVCGGLDYDIEDGGW